jgi:hypothetical protein
MTMTATIGKRKSGHDCMIVRFTSTYDSFHCHDYMIVRFTSTYDSFHGHGCMIVGFISTYNSCNSHDDSYHR